VTRPSLPDPRPAIVTMLAVFGAWYAAWQIQRAADLHLDVVVLAVVLALTLARMSARQGVVSGPRWLVRLVALPLVALLATEVGRLLAHHRWLGGAAFVVVLAGAVWLRRLGPLWSGFGTLVSLPFIALLVVPVPVGPATARTAWPAVMAVLVFGWVSLVHLVAVRVGVLPTRLGSAPSGPGREPRSAGRLPASSRMALQLLVGLAAAYTLGRWLFPDHWPWLVLSCYVVCSGNRGRGDVLHKGVLRLVGALVGTAGATLLSSPFPAGDRVAIVLLFVVMALASWLRSASYVFWAAGTTAMLALLQGYAGVGGIGELRERLLGVLLGAAVGVAASWFVLPVRSTAVFRRRWADALAALSGFLRALCETPTEAAAARVGFEDAVARLEELQPAFRFHRRTVHQLLRPSAEAHPTDLVVALVGVRDALAPVAEVPQEALASRRQVLAGCAHRVGVVRRRMRGEEGELVATSGPDEPTLAEVAKAVGRLEELFTVTVWRSLGGATRSVDQAPPRPR